VSQFPGKLTHYRSRVWSFWAATIPAVLPRRSCAAPAPSPAPESPLGRVERNLRIIHGRAMGRSLRDLADELGMSASGVRGVALRFEQEIALRRSRGHQGRTRRFPTLA